MKIDAIADLHGYFPEFKGGDLLIIAGDLTAKHSAEEYGDFMVYLSQIQKSKNNYKKIIYIGGNHDTFLDPKYSNMGPLNLPLEYNIEYLCDSGTEFDGLKIWGIPYSLWFHGINPNCKAFTSKERHIRKYYEKIPDDIDILISHGPPYLLNDKLSDGTHVGSHALREAIELKRPRLVICGHIHEAAGFCVLKIQGNGYDIQCYNVSCVDEHYQLKRGAIRIEI